MYIQSGKKERHHGSEGPWLLAPSTFPKTENSEECRPQSSGRSRATEEHSLGSPDACVLILALLPTCCVVPRSSLPSVSCLKYEGESKFQTEKIASTAQMHCSPTTKLQG